MTAKELIEHADENLSSSVEDEGIGPYEFWGASCTDSRLSLIINDTFLSVDCCEEGEIPTTASGILERDGLECSYTLLLRGINYKGGRLTAVYYVSLSEDDDTPELEVRFTDTGVSPFC